MANEFKATPDVMQQEGARITDEVAVSFKENIEGTYKTLDEMINRSFISSGARAIAEDIRSYRPVLEEMHKVILEYGEYCKSTSRMVLDNEDAIASEFKVNG